MAVNDGRHPDAEQLAEYADGVLGAEVRAAVETHLVDCADCRAVLAETMAFVASEQPAGKTRGVASGARVLPFQSRRWVKGAAAGLAAAAALVLVVRITRPDLLAPMFVARGDRPELQELIAAVANEPTRPVEGRLTGGFKYGPPPSATRGAGDRDVSPDVRIAAAKIEKVAREHNRASERADLGAALLVAGDCDRAVSVLEASAQQVPPDASALNNLSVAYIRCAEQRRGATDLLAKALAAANESMARAPEAPEGYFNRALSLELMGRSNEALDAWRRYLQIDAGSPWAVEAQAWISKRGR